MRPYKFIIYSFCVAGILLVSCNPTKDKWLNRNWHTMTGRFNVYFNGELKFQESMESLEAGHQNDFTKVLDVFPYGDEAAAKGMAGQMDVVLKKVSTAIQSHYVGRYTDDSYLLMGKAHFFKRDYYAAMEAFQYINSKYKDKGLRPISTAWIAKCYTGLTKVGEAEAVMGLLLSEEAAKTKKVSLYHRIFPETPKDYSREIYATAADIAIKQEKYSVAAEKLKIALQYTTRKQDKIRYTFILGQLYAIMDSAKLANKYFTKVLGMNASYDFEFNASLNLARAYDVNDRAAVKKVRRALKRMLRDDKNEGLYDQIWFELGNLEMKEKNIPAAIKAYKMAAAQQGKNPNQKALAYLALGNIYLELPDYKLAQAYYDSTASTISPNYKDYQKIMDKKMVLSDLISNLIVIETQDSLQALAALNQPQLEQKIDQWIASAKADSTLNAKRKKDRKEQEAMAKLNPQQSIATPNSTGFGEQGQWYFYNPTIMASGAAEFFSQRKWGQRANEDYWRIAAKEKEKTTEADEESGEERKENAGSDSSGFTANAKDTVSEKPAPSIGGDRQAWIKDVPFSNDAKEKSNAQLVSAFYNIGTIYNDKLNDAKEAIKDYELLLKRFPKNEYEPEVMYKLFKLYNAQKETAKAEAIRNRLIAEYPNSNYALIVQNKSISSAETDANREVVVFYEQTYSLYTEGNYEEVKRRKMEAVKKFPGNSLQPKFDLLYTLSVGRTDSLEIFKHELTELVKLYPQTDVAARAQGILDYIKKRAEVVLPDSLKPKEPDFVIDPAQGPFYVVLAIKDDKLDMNELIGRLTTYNEEYNQFDNLRNNTMLSNEGYQILMVREFKEMEKASTYHSDLQTRDAVRKRLKYEGNYIAFVISSANFKKMLKEQKIDSYNKLYIEYLNTKPKKQ